MSTVFVYHVVGDLTVGKPELVEFSETETVESAIRALSDCTECAIPVWKKKQSKNLKGLPESGESKQQRFVGIVNSMDISSEGEQFGRSRVGVEIARFGGS